MTNETTDGAEAERHRAKMAKRKAVQDAEVAGKTIERLRVVIVGVRDPMDAVKSRRVWARRQDMTFESEPRGGKRQHAAELATAKNPAREAKESP